jgi:hypothetical protein
MFPSVSLYLVSVSLYLASVSLYLASISLYPISIFCSRPMRNFLLYSAGHLSLTSLKIIYVVHLPLSFCDRKTHANRWSHMDTFCDSVCITSRSPPPSNHSSSTYYLCSYSMLCFWGRKICVYVQTHRNCMKSHRFWRVGIVFGVCRSVCLGCNLYNFYILSDFTFP